ncbi:MAG: hypothetical protein IPL58_12900 [Betaproteobacteria bacterium]|uniref:Uncharacterized protein n=1 Tax=Candidatus Proximibacter danicus TaxID=2954365 RepID=A0A9D7K5C0_9PROT|nr:hypothetical protein [Candidatus Proximibacter danicus]
MPLTSVAGFGALLFSGFPGLAGLGLYALTGVVTAALVTRFILPQLAGPTAHMRDLSYIGQRLPTPSSIPPAPALADAGARRGALAYLGVQRNDLWHENLSVLSTVSAEDARQMAPCVPI